MRELKSIWTEDFEIRSFENDFRQKLKMTTLFQYFQETAGRHVGGTPIGYEALKEIGLFWVLVRIRAKVHRMPEWRDTIQLKTWAKKMDKMFAYRECQVSNDTGLLISISSEWMLMSQGSRKPVRISTLPVAFPIDQKQALAGELSKLKPFGQLTLQKTRTALYSDIDMHNHVNNTKYVEWALDCIDLRLLREMEIDCLQVNFIAEVHPEDVIDIAKYEGENFCYFIEGYNRTRDAKAFQLELKLR